MLVAAACIWSVGPAAAGIAVVTPAAEFLEHGDSRTFAIEYVAQIPAAPPGTHVERVWLPVPHSTAAQTIRNLTFSQTPVLTHGRQFENEFAFWEIKDPVGSLNITMRFDCTRRELRTDLARIAAAGEGSDAAVSFAVFRQPSRLAVVTAGTRDIADDIVHADDTTLGKARAIYDYVLGHMRYDKTLPGWGTGSTEFACRTGRGNCTDFHALFDSLCGSVGIATEFEIGLLLPTARHSAEPLGGYHCWTYFRVPGRTWVPVDCSEASLQPRLRTYFFGSQTDNRVTLSVGRDLTLTPQQAGPPLNYFVDPYAEADGKPVKATKTWSFQDID
jgi:transglutaminase-like putative cysteine protease